MRSLIATVTASLLLLASAALAQDVGADEVVLKNGGSVRGTVISSVPGTSVKILEMGAKEPTVIPWSQVADVERGKYAPKGAPQPGPAGPGYGAAPPPVVAPAEPTLGTPGVVRLHIDSPVPANVIEHAGTQFAQVGNYGVVLTHFRPVCSAPCDKVIDGTAGQEFALVGSFPSPKAFQLAGLKSGDYNLSLKPGSTGMRVGGVVSIVLGGTLALTGAVLLPIGVAADSCSAYDLQLGTCTPSSGLKNAGIGTLVVGLVALGAGIAMAAVSGSEYTLAPAGAPGPTARLPRYWLGEF
jgi:hypothetical protein